MMNDLRHCHCYWVGGRSNIITVSILHTKSLSIPIQFSSAYVSSSTANKIWGKQKSKAVRINTTYPTKTGTWLQESWWFCPRFWRWKNPHGFSRNLFRQRPAASWLAYWLAYWIFHEVVKVGGWTTRSEKYDGQIGSFRIRGENNTYA